MSCEGDRIYNTEIVKSIKWHRENLGLTSSQVASYLSIHLTTYSKMENYKRVISASELKLISDLFGMTMDEISITPENNLNTSQYFRK
ncbi:helix-turn-helix domain-containing protein [Macrococcoides caseolyticum]|uniref:helix-turn-helix domain-containing protein n=1 Tax=Macrococcoides caseolyticum TaxID=69966 RepID=UPI0039C98B0A